MNLIMSEVEETIMIVDPDSVENGRGVVNVCFFMFLFFLLFRLYAEFSDLIYFTLFLESKCKRRLQNGKWRCCL